MFDIRARGSTVGREVLGGVTTFMAMSYILLFQPALLSLTGMDSGGVFMATCLSSAIACVVMGLWANYPVALAPGMGENTFFVFTVCGVGAATAAFRVSWQEGLALVIVAGVVFLLLSLVGFRSYLLNAIPDSLKSGIAAGIGLYIALIGFQWGNILHHDPATFLSLAELRGNHVALLTLAGLAVTFLLAALHLRGAILGGILITTGLTWAVGQVYHIPTIQWHGLAAMPSGLGKTAGQFVGGFGDLGSKLTGGHWVDVLIMGFILLFMAIFDTVGTLIGVAGRAGLIRDGKLPKAEQALASDAVGTIVGGALGTSTVTCYIESVTGVAAGARTGLAAIVTGVCLVAAMLFQPLADMVAAGVPVDVGGGQTVARYPMIAPALIFVGGLMMRALRDINWDDLTEALPGFLTLVTIPFAFSISHGIAIGFISYAFGKIVTGRAGQCPWIVYIFAALFVLRYALAP
jgi:AGZA family xanthine/uracil permease-like MFS transporter